MKKMLTLIFILLMSFVGCSANEAAKMIDIMQMKTTNEENLPVQRETLVVTNDPTDFYINDKIVGEQLEVTVDTLLEVTIENKSSFEFSIHFHGVDMVNNMDGVAGMTQDAIKPGTNFTYKLKLNRVGTYMYHSHVDSAEQIHNHNLDGMLIVKEKNDQQQHYGLLYNAKLNDIDAHHHAAYSFDELNVNGQKNNEIKVDGQENLLFNLTNLTSVGITMDFGADTSYKVTNLDAFSVDGTIQKNKTLYIPAANRAVVEVLKPTKSFEIAALTNQKPSAVTKVIVNGDSKSSQAADKAQVISVYDSFTNSQITTDLREQKPTKKFALTLDMEMMNWAINGQSFPNAMPLNVKENDVVDITLENTGHMRENHPFHLHGHEFQLIEIDGKKVERKAMMDTIEVQPDQKLKIRFVADNPGLWPIHCHDLTHAQKGMMTTVNYEGYTTSATGEMTE
ncbi:MAG: multicopper oxidase family protein [Mycoplasmatales bacterium]